MAFSNTYGKVVTATPIVRNGSFETSIDDWNVLSVDPTMTVAHDGTDGYSANGCMKISTASSAYGSALVGQSIFFESNLFNRNRLNFSLRYKRNYTGSPTRMTFRVSAVTAGEENGRVVLLEDSSITDDGTTWQQLQATVPHIYFDLEIYFSVVGATTASVKIDDVVLEDVLSESMDAPQNFCSDGPSILPYRTQDSNFYGVRIIYNASGNATAVENPSGNSLWLEDTTKIWMQNRWGVANTTYVVFPNLAPGGVYRQLTGTTYPSRIIWNLPIAISATEPYYIVENITLYWNELVGDSPEIWGNQFSDWGASMLVSPEGNLYFAGTTTSWSNPSQEAPSGGVNNTVIGHLFKRESDSSAVLWHKLVKGDYNTSWAGSQRYNTNIGNLLLAPNGDIILAYQSGGNGPLVNSFGTDWPPLEDNFYGSGVGRPAFMRISPDGDIISRQRYRPRSGFTKTSYPVYVDPTIGALGTSYFYWHDTGNNGQIPPVIGYIKSGNSVTGYVAIGSTMISGYASWAMKLNDNMKEESQFSKRCYLDVQGFVFVGTGPVIRGLDCGIRGGNGYLLFGAYHASGGWPCVLCIKTNSDLDVEQPYKEHVCELDYKQSTSVGATGMWRPRKAILDSENSVVVVGEMNYYTPYYDAPYDSGSSSAQDEFSLTDAGKSWAVGEHDYRTVRVNDGTTWFDKDKVIMAGGTTATKLKWADNGTPYDMLEPTPHGISYEILEGDRFIYSPYLVKFDPDTFEKTLEVAWHLVLYEGVADSGTTTSLTVTGTPWATSMWKTRTRVFFTNGPNENMSRTLDSDNSTNTLYWSNLTPNGRTRPLAPVQNGHTFKLISDQCYSAGGLCQVPGTPDYLVTFAYQNPNYYYGEKDHAFGVLRCGPDGEVKWATKIPRPASSIYGYNVSRGKILVTCANGRAFVAMEDQFYVRFAASPSVLQKDTIDTRISEITLDGEVIGSDCAERLTFEPAVHMDLVDVRDYSDINSFTTTWDSGTATSGSTTSLTDSSKSWPITDLWKGYVVRIAMPGPPGYYVRREVISSNSNTLTWDASLPLTAPVTTNAFYLHGGRFACAEPLPWYPGPNAAEAAQRQGWSSGAGATTTSLQDTSKTWTANQWVGYTVQFPDGPNIFQTRSITSNTGASDTPKCVAYWSGALPTSTSGHKYYFGLDSSLEPFFDRDNTLDDSPPTEPWFPIERGVATGLTTTSITDETKTWGVDQFKDFFIYVWSQHSSIKGIKINSNTLNTIAWDPAYPIGVFGTTYYYSVKIGNGTVYDGKTFPPYPPDYLEDAIDPIMPITPMVSCQIPFDPTTHMNSNFVVRADGIYFYGIARTFNSLNPCPADSMIVKVDKTAGAPAWATVIRHNGSYWKGPDSTDPDWSKLGDYWTSATGHLVSSGSYFILFLLGKKDDSGWFNRTTALVFDSTGALTNYRTWAIGNGDPTYDESEQATVHINKTLALSGGSFLNIGKSWLKTGSTHATHLAVFKVPNTILTQTTGAISPTVRLFRPRTDSVSDDNLTFSDQVEILEMREIDPGTPTAYVRCVACRPIFHKNIEFYAFDIDPATLAISNAKMFRATAPTSSKMHITGASIASDASFLVCGTNLDGAYGNSILVSVGPSLAAPVVLLSKVASGGFANSSITGVKFSEADEDYCFIGGNDFDEGKGYIAKLKVSDFSQEWGRYLNREIECEAGLYKMRMEEDNSNLILSDTASRLYADPPSGPVYQFSVLLSQNTSDGLDSVDCLSYYAGSVTTAFADGLTWSNSAFPALNSSSPTSVTEFESHNFNVTTEVMPTGFFCPPAISSFITNLYRLYTIGAGEQNGQ